MNQKIHKRHHRIKEGLCLLMAACLLSGCGALQTERDRPDHQICVVLKALNSHYWLDMRSGMEQAAADLQIDLTLLYPSGELENEEQQDLIADALESGADLLLTAPCDSFDTQWFVNKAKEKQIPVLTVDTQARDTELPYIGSDNLQIGRLAAEYLSDILPKNAFVAIMAGSSRQASLIDRINAFRDHLDPSFRVKIFYTDVTQQEGYAGIKTLEDQEVDAVLCANAVIGLGVATGMMEMGKKAEILAVDTPADALGALEAETMTALLAQDGYAIGYQAVETAVQTLKTGKLPENVLFPSELLTKQTVGEN